MSELDDILDAASGDHLDDDLDDVDDRGRLREVFGDEDELAEALAGRRIERVELVDGGAELLLCFDDGTAVSVVARAHGSLGPVEAAVVVLPAAPSDG